MLDIQFIRDNAELVQEEAKHKGVEVSIEALLKYDDERRVLIGKAETLRAQRNEIAQSMKGGKPDQATVDKGREVKEELAAIEAELGTIKSEYDKLMFLVPNVMHESVVRKPDEEGNTVIKTVGEKPTFDFEIKDHVQIGEDLDVIDLKTAAEVSGARFYYLKGDLVMLEQALTTWIMQKLVDKGFTPVITPTLVREEMMEATGFFPAERNEIYNVNPEDDNLFLAGTSEVPLTGLHQVKKLSEDDLPKFYVGYSTCYRREAGSYGKDTKGILRVHQFNKLEMYCFAHPDKSWEIHDQMLAIEEEILTELGLHYQVINIGSGDLGAPAAKKYDCEVWIPSQEKYRELTSCSNCTDYQTRRMGIKYSTKDGKKELAHTLNGTAMASTRTLIAIMENYQTADGHFKVPDVIQPFMGGKEII
jgi:seryl-tRNA synthetase